MFFFSWRCNYDFLSINRFASFSSFLVNFHGWKTKFSIFLLLSEFSEVMIIFNMRALVVDMINHILFCIFTSENLVTSKFCKFASNWKFNGVKLHQRFKFFFHYILRSFCINNWGINKAIHTRVSNSNIRRFIFIYWGILRNVHFFILNTREGVFTLIIFLFSSLSWLLGLVMLLFFFDFKSCLLLLSIRSFSSISFFFRRNLFTS